MTPIVTIASHEVFRVPPPTLFHYTSHEAAVAILSSGALWATHIGYLNDTQELQHAVRQLTQLVDGMTPKRVGPHSDVLRDALKRGVRELSATNIGVFSLTENPDLLSQWRAYCPRGVGYAIGIDIADLAETVPASVAQLGACAYDPELQRALLSELLEQAIAHFASELEIPKTKVQTAAYETRVRFAKDAARLAAFVKHHTFREEREWRLVTRAVSDASDLWGFRPGRVSLVPHLLLRASLGDRPIRLNSVVVGPTPAAPLALRAAQLFFGRHGLEQDAVTASTVPFRAW